MLPFFFFLMTFIRHIVDSPGTGNEVHYTHWWEYNYMAANGNYMCFVQFVPERNVSSTSCGVGKLITI